MSRDVKAPSPSRKPNGASPAPKKGSIVGRAWRGAVWVGRWPAEAMGISEIRKHARLIAMLFRMLNPAPHKDRRLHLAEDRGIDLRATAFLCGVSERLLEEQLRRRRRQSAISAYVAFGLGCMFLLAWLWRALTSPRTALGLVSAIEFLPFCGIFFLSAFNNALLNFQLRTGRMATWREYLSTNEQFWPD